MAEKSARRGAVSGSRVCRRICAAEQYNHITAQVVYSIANIGDIAATFAGNNNRLSWKEEDLSKAGALPDPNYIPFVREANAVYGAFYLTAIENLSLNVGLKYTLAVSEDKLNTGTAAQPNIIDAAYTDPIEAGFSVAYAISDTIGVKARFEAAFAGKVKIGDDTADLPFALSFEALPYFDLGILKLYVGVGASYRASYDKKLSGSDEDTSALNWHFNPYISKAAGGGMFFVGFYVKGNGDKRYPKDGKFPDDKRDNIEWGVPFGLQVSF